MRYLTVRGPGSTEVAHHIRKDCELRSTTEALTDLSTATTRDALLPAIYAAALSATHQDAQELADAFQSVANHPDPEVRQSVLTATAYFPHPPLIDLVRELRNSDPSAHIRHNTQHLLDAQPLDR